jgi:hypothetical protein
MTLSLECKLVSAIPKLRTPYRVGKAAAANAMLSLVRRSVCLSPLAHLPLSLPSLLPHPPGERRKKPFNILFFFSSPPSPLYPTLPLFFFAPAFSFFSFIFLSFPLLCSESLGVRSPCSWSSRVGFEFHWERKVSVEILIQSQRQIQFLDLLSKLILLVPPVKLYRCSSTLPTFVLSLCRAAPTTSL